MAEPYKKTIDIVVPVYNEIENIDSFYQALLGVIEQSLSEYDCRILFIDNYSNDGTREAIEKICIQNERVMAIFNSRNFGAIRSVFYGLINSHADCTIQMAADFQDPPEMIPKFVEKWAEGNKIVIAKKLTSKENPIMFFIRSQYYGLLKRIADIEHIEHFTGYGLYDRCVVDALRKMDDSYPYLRGMISEIGFKRAEVIFEQPKRRAGKTKANFYGYYDVGMLGITSYSKVLMRLATFLGFAVAIFSVLVALFYLVLKLAFWSEFAMGYAPLAIGVFFIGAVELFFIGLLGEYILNINTRIMKRPLIFEEKRLNMPNNEAISSPNFKE